MKKVIELRNVSYDYKSSADERTTGVKNISLTVNKGEFVVLLGHNGSGKSTLAKLLNAFLIPDQGDVIINGINTKEEKRVFEIRSKVGMVFQNPDNQLVATTVEEDVAFGPENLGIPSAEIERRITEALKAVDMLSYRLHSPHQLSGGQKQRVAIAGVISMLPKCIVLDEPTAMLDPAGRSEVMRTIHRLNKEQRITVLHITHHMDEVIGADRVIVMDEGRIVLQGTPREVFSQVELLRRLHLDVPQVTDLAERLRNRGCSVPQGILTVNEMVMLLCPSD